MSTSWGGGNESCSHGGPRLSHRLYPDHVDFQARHGEYEIDHHGQKLRYRFSEVDADEYPDREGAEHSTQKSRGQGHDAGCGLGGPRSGGCEAPTARSVPKSTTIHEYQLLTKTSTFCYTSDYSLFSLHPAPTPPAPHPPLTPPPLPPPPLTPHLHHPLHLLHLPTPRSHFFST